MSIPEIHNEEDLFQLVELIAFNRQDRSPGSLIAMADDSESLLEEVCFVDWPYLELTICGERFDGGIPARLMPAIHSYQWMLDRAYARSLGKDARGLTLDERKRIELVVGLKPGSTSIISDISTALNSAVQLVQEASSMSEAGATATIVCTAVFFAAGIVKANMRKETKRSLSEQETERLRIVADLARDSVDMRAALSDMSKTNRALLKCLENDDRLFVDGEFIVNGRDANRIARKRRRESVRENVYGEFYVRSIGAPVSRKGIRVVVCDVDSEDEFTVDIPPSRVSDRGLSVLSRALLEKAPVPMHIHAMRRGTTVVHATLLSLDPPGN